MMMVIMMMEMGAAWIVKYRLAMCVEVDHLVVKITALSISHRN